jgi:hypothetical protein
MKKKTKIAQRAVITILTVLSSLISLGQSKNENKPSVIPINDAIDKKMLEFKISGTSDPRIFYEIVDRDGVHFGKCMAIILKSNIDSLVLLKIDCGIELIPFDTTFQTMIVTKSVELPLYPGKTYATRFYAMCGQLHDDPPYIESTYKIGELSDSNTVKLAQYFEKNYIQDMTGQHALWAYTDKADFKELEKYGADSFSIALTSKILNDLSIETSLNPNIRTTDKLPEETIQVSKIVFIGTAAILIILLTSTLYLLVKKRTRDEPIV